MKGQKAMQEGRLEQAVRHLESSFRKHGNQVAALNLAEFSYTGTGTGQCYAKSLDYYYQALRKTNG